jgi:hypothetical protein
MTTHTLSITTTTSTTSSTAAAADATTTSGHVLPSSTSCSGDDGGGARSKTPLTWQQTKAWLSAFVLNNFMLLSFTLAAALAMAWPLPGRVVASWSVGDVRVVQALNNFIVFLISGLTLKSDDFRWA